MTKALGGRRATESSLAVVGQGATSPTLCDDSQHNVQPEDVLKYRTHLNQKASNVMYSYVLYIGLYILYRNKDIYYIYV